MTGETQQITITQQMRAIHIAQPGVQSSVPLMAPPITPPIASSMIEPVPELKPQSPPFEFEEWTMRETGWGFVWARRGRWLTGVAMRAIGYFVLSLLFVLLGVGTQTRGLAAVEPAWLPWLGLAVALLLVGLAMRAMWVLLTSTVVLVDMTRREMRCQRHFLGRRHWRVSFDQIAYVLVSQTPIRPEGREKSMQPVSTAQDVWLHIHDGTRFLPVAELGRVEGHCRAWEQVRQSYKTKGRRRLTLAFYDTPAHHAARVMADAMQVDVWLDIR
jgi:hypothetical protein